jgi:hypothetical protein
MGIAWMLPMSSPATFGFVLTLVAIKPPRGDSLPA